MSNFNFEVGDKVRIVANENLHQFKIGQIVTITELIGEAEELYYRADSDNDHWYVADEDLELVEKGVLSNE